MFYERFQESIEEGKGLRHISERPVRCLQSNYARRLILAGPAIGEAKNRPKIGTFRFDKSSFCRIEFIDSEWDWW